MSALILMAAQENGGGLHDWLERWAPLAEWAKHDEQSTGPIDSIPTGPDPGASERQSSA
jgi:hypothetical protein